MLQRSLAQQCEVGSSGRGLTAFKMPSRRGETRCNYLGAKLQQEITTENSSSPHKQFHARISHPPLNARVRRDRDLQTGFSPFAPRKALGHKPVAWTANESRGGAVDNVLDRLEPKKQINRSKLFNDGFAFSRGLVTVLLRYSEA